MKISRREEGAVTVIEPKGKITIGEGDVLLREEITKLLSEEKKQLVLDLGGISYMDSAGVGELVSVYTSVKNRGGELKLASLTKKIKDLLQITQLMTIFDTYETAQEAVSAFK
jgi:anti-sigma B factor antagonist